MVVKASPNSHGASKDYDARSMARVHTILFPHNAPGVVNYLFNTSVFGPSGIFDVDQMKNLLFVFFITDKGSPDELAASLFGSAQIMARSFVAAQYILVAKRENKWYTDLDVTGVRESIMNNTFENLAHEVKKGVAVRFVEQLGSDVAQNQHTDE